MRKDDLVLCFRTWVFCVFGATIITGAGYGLLSLENEFFPGGARGSSEWLFFVPFIVLLGFAFAIFYAALVAFITAVAAVYQPGASRIT
jgi:hypothetical protein